MSVHGSGLFHGGRPSPHDLLFLRFRFRSRPGSLIFHPTDYLPVPTSGACVLTC